jgi:very-short-patch-repair endonuclease
VGERVRSRLLLAGPRPGGQDGLRYHRTPAEQARDRLRDQAHTAAGLAQLRFTHEQVRYEPEYVVRILAQTASRFAIATK